MKLKKLLSGLLAGAMLASTALVGVTSASDEFPFTDVPVCAWYASAVEDVYKAGLMKGKTDTKFDPNAPMSRAEFVTVLSRLAATNATNYNYADSLTSATPSPAL